VHNREQARYQVWFPVQLQQSGQRANVVMAHNSSTAGMLVAINSAIDVGATVQLSFRLPPSPVEHRMTGRVLRIEPNVEDPEGLWPQRIAIAFDAIEPQLAPYLQATATRLGQT
jgi:PilZ domain